MQPRADLRLLEFAEIAIHTIEPLQQGVPTAGQFQPIQLLLELLLQQGRTATAQLLRLPVLIQQPFQLRQWTVQPSATQWRGEVIKDQGLAAALRLGSLTGVIDDEGIEVGHRPQRQLGEATRGLADAFARQPLQVAVLAQMHHHMGAELLPQPEVVRQVGVGGGQIGAVVAEAGVAVIAA